MAITFPKNPEMNEVTNTPAGPYYWNGKSWCSGMPQPKPAKTAPIAPGTTVGQIHSVFGGVAHVWNGTQWLYLADNDDFFEQESYYREQAKAMIK